MLEGKGKGGGREEAHQKQTKKKKRTPPPPKKKGPPRKKPQKKKKPKINLPLLTPPEKVLLPLHSLKRKMGDVVASGGERKNPQPDYFLAGRKP